MLKKLLIGIGVLVGVVVLALVAVVSLVDVNQYKPQIEQAVKEKTGRTLRIEGPLKLSVFPRLGIELPRTTLSNLGADRTAAALQSARVSVALVPLLSKRIEIDRIHIDGLAATIERRKDGSTNIDDLIKPDPKARPAPPGGKAAPLPQFEIGGVELSNADLTYNDLAAGNTMRLHQLNLKTGRLAPQTRSAVSLSSQISATRPTLAAKIDAKGDLDVDLERSAYAVGGFDLALKGTLDKQPLDVTAKASRLAFDAASGGLRVADLRAQARGRVTGEDFDADVTAPKLDIAADKASGERVLAKFKLSGAARQLNGQLALDGVSGQAKQVSIAKVALDATLQQGPRKTVAALTGSARANTEAQTFSLPQFAGTVSLDDPSLPQKTLKLPLNGTVDVDAKKETAAARIATTAEGSKFDAKVNVAGFATPRIGFDLAADKLNLDTWFPPEKAARNASATPAPAAKGGGVAPAPADAPVDLSALKTLNLSGEARIGQFQARGIKLSNLRAPVKAANGRLDVAPLTAQLYGGTVTASVNAQAAGNRVGLDANLANVQIEPLMKDAVDKDLLEGRGNVKLVVTTAGASVDGMKRALAGNAALQLRDGAVKGINIAQKLRDAQSLLSVAGVGKSTSHEANAAEKTDFSELSATFAIKDGVATNSDLDAKSPLLRLGGAGKIDIGAGRMDYVARVSVVGTLKGQDGRTIDQLRGATIPVRVAGPFEKLSYGIDYSGAAQEALKSKLNEQLQRQLGGGSQSTPQSGATPDKPASSRDRAKDLLKGLLGR